MSSKKVRGVLIETLHSPATYSREELDCACVIASHLGRGKLLLVLPPAELRDDD